ncbi:family 10 glycosylhydrolase [uncultured Flavonifractor sp.]|uniref:family 10 glycosylhydrolase n=1 Tax=uncultured Flavonifractor sp. TaxID=1193534 RepID=UPI00262ABC9A|nr:family 10 glycosylhydrolase [uncultured Flavonifractor sp.]
MTKLWKLAVAAVLICALVLVGMTIRTQTSAGQGEAKNPDQFRAVWVSTVYRLDYPSKATTDPAVLKADADKILQTCADLGMTAVILQVRPSADALYPSNYYPWSADLTGRQGQAPADGFDPLEYWVEQAHALGLELHAWINPFRVTKGGQSEYDSLTADHPAKVHPDWVVEYDGKYYFDPGLPDVREYIIQSAEELARNYDIDGIHLDDYFYPGANFDDGDTYAQYGSNFSDVGDWRRDNVNQLVKALGERLHAIDPELSYGISPSGVWADRSSQSQGSNTTGGFESYYASYADSRKWVKEGWIDYICPQVYWYIGHSSMDYETIVKWWADTVKGTGVSLYIGMADYQAGNTDPSSPWHGVEAIRRQLALNETIPQVDGEVHFRYQFLAENTQLQALYREFYHSEQEVFLNTEEHMAYVQGSAGQFHPESSLTRGEAVTLLARLTVDGEGKNLYTWEEGTGGFSDVSPGDWYSSYVHFAQKYGIVRGYGDGTFRPTQAVSRAELVKMVTSFFVVTGGSHPFPDVSNGYWAAREISFAAAQGWITGGSDGTFQPERSVTRAEAVKILNKAMGREAGEREAALPFTDVSRTHWAYGEILEASVTHDYKKTSQGEVWL